LCACRHILAEVLRFLDRGCAEVVMVGKTIKATLFVATLVAAPASVVGDATYTLASYRAMAEIPPSPAERIMAVYMASAERAEMLARLQEKYPILVR